MIANYGYEDGSGQYYISVDTDQCADCDDKPCVHACAKDVYVIEEDDWDEKVVAVEEGKKVLLGELCSSCKGNEHSLEPCLAACPHSAMKHSW